MVESKLLVLSNFQVIVLTLSLAEPAKTRSWRDTDTGHLVFLKTVSGDWGSIKGLEWGAEKNLRA